MHKITSEQPASREHRHGNGRMTRRKPMRPCYALVLAGGGVPEFPEGKTGESFFVDSRERRPLLNPSQVSGPSVRTARSLVEKFCLSPDWAAVPDKPYGFRPSYRPRSLNKSLISCFSNPCGLVNNLPGAGPVGRQFDRARQNPGQGATSERPALRINHQPLSPFPGRLFFRPFPNLSQTLPPGRWLDSCLQTESLIRNCEKFMGSGSTAVFVWYVTGDWGITIW